ncbi:hypothetical protein [Streptomyces goshikiensis]|uniref:hypothetical protein n=1 Tax=Streptomyces goshikiensis TaxID=1942 RepID=UPI0036541D14
MLFENTDAASALYNELVTTEVCETLGVLPSRAPSAPVAERRWRSRGSRTS